MTGIRDVMDRLAEIQATQRRILAVVTAGGTMEPLTTKQAEIWELIMAWKRERGYVPSPAEVAESLETDVSAIRRHYRALRELGYLHGAASGVGSGGESLELTG